MREFIALLIGCTGVLALLLWVVMLGESIDNEPIIIEPGAPAVAVDNGGQVAEAFVKVNEQNIELMGQYLDQQAVPWVGISVVVVALIVLLVGVVMHMQRLNMQTMEKVIESVTRAQAPVQNPRHLLFTQEQRQFMIEQVQDMGYQVINVDDRKALPIIEHDGQQIVLSPKQLEVS